MKEPSMTNNPTGDQEREFHFGKSMDAAEIFVPRADANGRVDARPASEIAAADLDND
jgi:hypothetical protein